ncbi:hypothetical protein CC1G_14696 [Coprinopsis cinerea okayama7|uniref:Uncharacterized protein n=1 Tax=Coprinopsis cinerea (strain Okayama-7 / 130 / ATCC MYA-4618 / FGSC 9003) TaxID=240176 RepID=D6RML0_COPC7|nr:hypothetical protein CC1G_14696 [Coprinopsis cinerea okayama7\|eukprot:XP_002911267.1 hypothetical protein CC1G_14696 [Coprinopsis cinerea okayama7\
MFKWRSYLSGEKGCDDKSVAFVKRGVQAEFSSCWSNPSWSRFGENCVDGLVDVLYNRQERPVAKEARQELWVIPGAGEKSFFQDGKLDVRRRVFQEVAIATHMVLSSIQMVDNILRQYSDLHARIVEGIHLRLTRPYLSFMVLLRILNADHKSNRIPQASGFKFAKAPTLKAIVQHTYSHEIRFLKEGRRRTT